MRRLFRWNASDSIKSVTDSAESPLNSQIDSLTGSVIQANYLNFRQLCQVLATSERHFGNRMRVTSKTNTMPR